jgi:uncharacterized membrane protein YkgB
MYRIGQHPAKTASTLADTLCMHLFKEWAFPLLTLLGQFLLKDTGLASAAITLMARDAATQEAKLPWWTVHQFLT